MHITVSPGRFVGDFHSVAVKSALAVHPKTKPTRSCRCVGSVSLLLGSGYTKSAQKLLSKSVSNHFRAFPVCCRLSCRPYSLSVASPVWVERLLGCSCPLV